VTGLLIPTFVLRAFLQRSTRCIVTALSVAALGGWYPIAAAAGLSPWLGGSTPSLVLKDLRGARHDLAAYRGKVVLVNFWATWCEPCRDEMPSMQRLERELAGQPFVVLAVNADEPEARIRSFLSRTALDFTILLDPEMRAARAWNARILPASFVIDRNGRVRYSSRGELDWASPGVVSAIKALIAAPDRYSS
jgi:thiol-disulfide isomerase/thioredoxin